jgi:hypothetical protein
MKAARRLSALGLAGLVLGCGTERIELRPGEAVAPQPIGPQNPLPVVEVSSTAPSGGQDATPVGAPGRDGLLVPDAELLPPPASRTGCTKVDFLFVIDNSSSMRDEQANLTRSFPGFVQVMQQVVDVDDYHIMVVSTSGEREEEDEPTLDPEECEEIQGAGRRRNGDGDDCGLQGGLAYLSQNQPDIETTFACIAQVGTGGSAVEEPMDALIAATSASLNAPGRCNAGFLRQDAILVVTVITDEEDESDGEPPDWRRTLFDLKQANADALVVLGLVGDNNIEGGLPFGPCAASDADGAPRLQQFVSSFGGMLGSVCAPDYTPFFQTAVGSIDSACEDFVPPTIE